MSQTTDKQVYITANDLNKSLKQAILDGDLSGGGGGGGGSLAYEVFNLIVANTTQATSLTGVAYFRAHANMTISVSVMQIFEKGGITTGNLEIDLKKNTTPNNTGMTSIYTTKPILSFANVATVDYSSNNGTLNPSLITLNAGDWLRLDITQIPAGLSKFYVEVYAQ